MSIEPTRQMPRGRLILVTLGALVVGVLIVVGAILPAEYNKDPLGLGKLTGIGRLWAPEETAVDVKAGATGPAAKEYEIPFREDVVEIPLGGFLTGVENSELEWKVRMKKGATITYSWEAEGATGAQDFAFDQHGHTTPPPGQGMTVASYRKGFGLHQRGALTAPFDGIHGWLFQNTTDKPMVVKVKVAGFYELIPGGQPGNERNVVPNVPAAKARPDAPLALKAAP